MSETPPLLEFKNVSKRFGDVVANTDISFRILAGSIHGIIGENGAGKSTAMKILFGLYQPDEGEIFLRGEKLSLHSPRDAMKAGIGMIHQHFMLAETLTALDNILLHDKEKSFFLNRQKRKSALQALAKNFGFEIDLERKIHELSVGQQQRIEILKILSQNSEIIILDEPTAVLTPQEIENLFENLRHLKKMGKTILIITHKLNEVLNITDQVTVFRQGRVVANRVTSRTQMDELAELMIGYRPAAPPTRTSVIDSSQTILKIAQLSAQRDSHRVQDLNFKLSRKEIVGIAGVEGNGQDVLIRSILDPLSLRPQLNGTIHLLGQPIHKKSALQIREAGVGAFPEDRLRYGVLPQRPLHENFLLGLHRFKKYMRGPFIHFPKLFAETHKALTDYDVRPQNIYHPIDKMSGGNQQKLVVARELSHGPSFILAAQPTRGVDIGAVQFIHQQLRESRDQGAGILLISSELDELLQLCDRIFVLFKGKLVAEFSKSQFDSYKIGAAMGGKTS